MSLRASIFWFLHRFPTFPISNLIYATHLACSHTFCAVSPPPITCLLPSDFPDSTQVYLILVCPMPTDLIPPSAPASFPLAVSSLHNLEVHVLPAVGSGLPTARLGQTAYQGSGGGRSFELPSGARPPGVISFITLAPWEIYLSIHPCFPFPKNTIVTISWAQIKATIYLGPYYMPGLLSSIRCIISFNPYNVVRRWTLAPRPHLQMRTLRQRKVNWLSQLEHSTWNVRVSRGHGLHGLFAS